MYLFIALFSCILTPPSLAPLSLSPNSPRRGPAKRVLSHELFRGPSSMNNNTLFPFTSSQDTGALSWKLSRTNPSRMPPTTCETETDSPVSY